MMKLRPIADNYQYLSSFDDNNRKIFSFYIRKPKATSQYKKPVTFRVSPYDNDTSPVVGYNWYFAWDGFDQGLHQIYKGSELLDDALIETIDENWYRVSLVVEGTPYASTYNGDVPSLYFYNTYSTATESSLPIQYQGLGSDNPDALRLREYNIGGWQIENVPTSDSRTTPRNYVSNEGRLNFRRVNLLDRSYLIEEGAEGDGYWLNTNNTITTSSVDSGASVFAGENMVVIEKDSTAYNYIRTQPKDENDNRITFQTSATMVLSFYIKQYPDENFALSAVSINLYDDTVTQTSYTARATFNTYGGAPTITTTNATDAGYEDVGDGWYRIWAVVNSDDWDANTVDGDNLAVWFYPQNTSDTTLMAGYKILVMKPQLEIYNEYEYDITNPVKSYEQTGPQFGWRDTLGWKMCVPQYKTPTVNKFEMKEQLGGGGSNIIKSVYFDVSGGEVLAKASYGSTVSSIPMKDGWFRQCVTQAGLGSFPATEGESIIATMYVARTDDAEVPTVGVFGEMMATSQDDVDWGPVTNYQPVWNNDKQNFDVHTELLNFTMDQFETSAVPIRCYPKMNVRVTGNTTQCNVEGYLAHNWRKK